ncbi:MAG: hypothetical protein GY847_36410 [Proteobacteria bacterium]|nr:hypothetical protein [Pseudomonadota bacterium]
MYEDGEKAPEQVMALAERCTTHVKNRFGFELDFANETLSVLDHFVRDVLEEEGDGKPPPPGDKRRAHLIHLLAPTIGAYFGEVICRIFPCRWRLKTEDPQDWLLEFEHVPLRFSPIGAAAEALAEQKIDSWNGSIDTTIEETEALGERLAVAPPVPENEFYALTTRFEVLQIAEDWLRNRKAAKDPPDPEFYTPQDYDRIFEI